MSQQNGEDQKANKKKSWQEFQAIRHHYHYLRYSVFGIFLVALGILPLSFDNPYIPFKLVAMFGMSLSVVVFVMDIRNYRIFRDYAKRSFVDESKSIIPIVTVTLSLFYIICFASFLSLLLMSFLKERTITIKEITAKNIHASECLSHIKAVDKINTDQKDSAVCEMKIQYKVVHLSSGWTKIKSVRGMEYIIKNSDIISIY